MKLALKSLAKLHAMSFAYFNSGEVNIKEFSSALKLMIDKFYQPSASSEDKSAIKAKLNKDFDHLVQVVSKTPEGKNIADLVQAKFKDRLYAIYKDAHESSSQFSVLCHGFPVQGNIMFSYHMDGPARNKPKDAKLINFQVIIFWKLVSLHMNLQFDTFFILGS